MTTAEIETESAKLPDNRQIEKSRMLGLVSMGIAMFSLLIAGMSGYLSYGTRVDTIRHNIVEDLYETFEEWNQYVLAKPFLLHLLASPKNYDYVSGLVEQGVESLPDEQVVELMLAERAMTVVVFAAYDELLSDLHVARASGDDHMIDAVNNMLRHFEEQVLPNPRLRHLWLELGNNRRKEVRQRYAENVTKKLSITVVDTVGPMQRARD